MQRSSENLGDIPADEFRKYGYAVVDMITNYFERIEDFPVLSQIEPGSLKESLPSSPPAVGEDFGAVLNDVDKLIEDRVEGRPVLERCVQ